jgi:hypothetical protein
MTMCPAMVAFMIFEALTVQAARGAEGGNKTLCG